MTFPSEKSPCSTLSRIGRAASRSQRDCARAMARGRSARSASERPSCARSPPWMAHVQNAARQGASWQAFLGKLREALNNGGLLGAGLHAAKIRERELQNIKQRRGVGDGRGRTARRSRGQSASLGPRRQQFRGETGGAGCQPIQNARFVSRAFGIEFEKRFRSRRAFGVFADQRGIVFAQLGGVNGGRAVRIWGVGGQNQGVGRARDHAQNTSETQRMRAMLRKFKAIVRENWALRCVRRFAEMDGVAHETVSEKSRKRVARHCALTQSLRACARRPNSVSVKACEPARVRWSLRFPERAMISRAPCRRFFQACPPAYC